MLKRLLLTSLIIVAVVGFLVGTKLLQFQAMGAAAANMPIPIETVTAAEATEQSWSNVITATGTVAAVQGVTVSTEVPGKVAEIAFESGQTVAAGDLLVRLDISVEEAQLRAAEASAELARANLTRARELREKQTNSQAELDAAEAQAKEAEAQVENIRAAIEKKSIKAPFAGRLGIRMVNLGQYLGSGDPITTLQSIGPVYVNFSVPQQQLSVLATDAGVRVSTDAALDQTFEGKINAISPEIDMVTRNIRVQATIPEPEEKLRPGMFANVEVVLPTSERVLAVPATAVLYAPYGDSVFVIEEQNNEQTGEPQLVLRQQFIRIGGTRGDYVAISSGLEPGQRVVTSAPFKLRPGTPVVVDNTLALKAELNPRPDNS